MVKGRLMRQLVHRVASVMLVRLASRSAAVGRLCSFCSRLRQRLRVVLGLVVRKWAIG